MVHSGETKHRYLEVTFRHGRPLAAYLYLPRRAGDKSARTEEAGDGILIDRAEDGRPIGIEIVSPSSVTLDSLNAALRRLKQEPATIAELSPLLAA